jgi:hypothetical protein
MNAVSPMPSKPSGSIMPGPRAHGLIRHGKLVTADESAAARPELLSDGERAQLLTMLVTTLTANTEMGEGEVVAALERASAEGRLKIYCTEETAQVVFDDQQAIVEAARWQLRALHSAEDRS